MVQVFSHGWKDAVIRIERMTGTTPERMGLWALEALRLRPDGSEDPGFVLVGLTTRRMDDVAAFRMDDIAAFRAGDRAEHPWVWAPGSGRPEAEA